MSPTANNTVKIILLLLIDLVAFYVSLVGAFFTRKLLTALFPAMPPLLPSLHFFLSIFWLPAIFLSFIMYERLYVKKLPFWDETRELIKAVTIATISVLAVITLGKMTDEISRLTILFLWAFSVIVFPLFRLIGKRVLYELGIGIENVIIIGAGTAGTETAKGIHNDIHLGYHVTGFLDDDERIGGEIVINDKAYRVFGKIGHFRKYIRLHKISTVIIAIPSLPAEKMSKLTNEIQKYTRSVLLVPDVKGVALTNSELYYLFMEQLFILKINNNLKSPFNRLMKRSFELVLSILVFPILITLIALIAVLVKLDSEGPIFHVEDRFGKNKSVFKCIKFRTMFLNNDHLLRFYLASHPDVEENWRTYKKLKGYDPRVTRIGAILRKLSLDELPQIINVVKGEMSLVGSRPFLPREESDMKYYIDTILLAPPGITGLWQVSGRNKLTFDERLRVDAWYILNWSLWLDIVILLKTVKVILNKEGAY